jgi:hypothetical protein
MGLGWENEMSEWEILDDNGDTIQRLELDNTPGVELKITYVF